MSHNIEPARRAHGMLHRRHLINLGTHVHTRPATARIPTNTITITTACLIDHNMCPGHAGPTTCQCHCHTTQGDTP